MPDYSEVVRDHFFRPRNCGSLDDPSGVGTEGTPGAGPFMEIYVKLGSVCRGCWVRTGGPAFSPPSDHPGPAL